MNTVIYSTHQLQWSLLMLKIIHILILIKKVNDKDRKFKVGDHVRISKTFLLKAIHQIVQKKHLLLKKLRILFHGLMLLAI